MKRFRGEYGFALPTIVIASLVLMMILVAALSATTSTRSALEEQYYNQLSREAAEAGWVKAEACLAQTGTAAWAAGGKTLRPETDCNGNTAITCPSSNADCYVAVNGNIRTSFTIGAPTVGDYGKTAYTVNSVTELTRPGATPTVWKTVNGSVNYSTANVKTPRISGGAGWDMDNHIGLIATADNQLFGFGANDGGQLIDSPSASNVTSPTKLVLPSGVQTVKKISTSGTGTSAICIIGGNDRAYCRGNSGSIGGTTAWQKVAVPGDLPVRDLSINGFGNDNACVIAGATSISAQAYCWGWNGYSMLGDGTTTDRSITSPVRFVIPSGLYAKKVEIQSLNACVIASDDQAYCAGRADGGQLMGTVKCYGCAYLPEKLKIPTLGTITRKVESVIMHYHVDEDLDPDLDPTSIYALTTDGFIWAGGGRYYGSHAVGSASGGTGTSRPDLFGYNTSSTKRSTGGSIKSVINDNKCVDINNADFYNGSRVQIWDCANADAQRFSFTKQGDMIVATATSASSSSSGALCIDVPNANFVNGQQLQLWECNGTGAQRWRVDSSNRIASMGNSNFCIDLPGGSISNGTSLTIYTCNTANGQKFNSSSSTQPWQGMIANTTSFCGVRSDQTSGVWCGGDGSFGQLANVAHSSLGGGAHDADCGDSSASSLNMQMDNGTGYRKIDITKLSSEWKYQYLSLQVIATDGNVYGAGQNTYGKLGNGSTSSAQCKTVKMNLPAGVTALDMSTRDQYSTYVLGSDGNVYAAGLNNLGQLGDGTTTNRSTPVTTRMPRAGAAY